jgi:hypothetical protein
MGKSRNYPHSHRGVRLVHWWCRDYEVLNAPLDVKALQGNFLLSVPHNDSSRTKPARRCQLVRKKCQFPFERNVRRVSAFSHSQQKLVAHTNHVYLTSTRSAGRSGWNCRGAVHLYTFLISLWLTVDPASEAAPDLRRRFLPLAPWPRLARRLPLGLKLGEIFLQLFDELNGTTPN